MVARLSGVLVFAFAELVLADVYTYECDSVPAITGWDLFQITCEAEEWIDDGQLVQSVMECAEFPGFGAMIDYFHDIDALSGATNWFIEWRMVTTGISDEIPWVAPAALVASDGNGFIYHFTISDDLLRVIVGFQLTLYVDFEPGMHTFRLEVSGEDLGGLFTVYMDGNFIDSGVPTTPLFNPPYQAVVAMHAQSKLIPSTTTWDYIRWGDIPADGSGDFDSNGEVNDDDLYFFQECLETNAGNWPGCAWADFDFDIDVDCDDAAHFAVAWTGPGAPPALPQCASTCPADLDETNTVDAGDLALLLGAWGPGIFADLNGDDLVNASDLAELLGSWGACQ